MPNNKIFLFKFSIILLSSIYLFVFDVGFLFAQLPDTTPPEILSFDFNPKSADTTNGNVNIFLIIGARDDQTGVASGFVRFKHTSGLLLSSGFGSSLSGVLTITQSVPLGTYTVDEMGVTDNAGNTAILSTDMLRSGGFPTELFVGNTPPGSNIIVGPISGVTVTYPEVTQGGQTTISSNTAGPTPPSGFKLGNPPTYYSVSTTAQFNPPVGVCIIYDDTQFKNEKNLKLFHFEDGAWLNVTTRLDVTNNIICGNVSSFSDFALMENISTDHLINDVQNANIKTDVKQGLLDKLTAAKDAIERGQKKTAVNILKAFINQVKAQKGKAISDDQADLFTADAQALINQLGGNLLHTIFKWILFGWLDKFVNALISNKL